jgi:hypothetical protein
MFTFLRNLVRGLDRTKLSTGPNSNFSRAGKAKNNETCDPRPQNSPRIPITA